MSGEHRRVLVVFNPVAGRRRRRLFRATLEGLTALGCIVTVRATTGPGDAERFAAAAPSSEFEVIVAAGGDGTLNEVANGMRGGEAARRAKGRPPPPWPPCRSVPSTSWRSRSSWP